MARKKSETATLDALLAAGDLRAARAEAARLASEPGGEAAGRAAAARFGPERGAAVAVALGVLLLLAVALLGLRQP